ncbi:15842_t:CDS:2 [Dentiscutata erythropus]|uniref:15842_t:CDS:1 n=1 Tax=Dentiscutata erythropus TaxID=1348616 RepID=A0A9N9HUR6_9GLOM|nr:15842_t:CDS:2 [Dentiscutata erythropus]
MQEVEILPRDVYIHYLNVPKGKVILWWFSTKKKNISFGLFQRKDHIVTPRNVFIAAPNAAEAYQDVNLTGQISPTKTPISEHRPSSKSLASSLKSRNSIDTCQTEENDDINEDDTNSTLNSLQSRGRKKSVSAQIAKDPSLKEILPIEHYNSATTTIKGSYKATEEGTYCLCFDIEEDQNEPEISGWLLKKKRKKMQGWAKRWVEIDNGVLSYYQHPHSPCRGKIHIVLSTVASNQSYRSIHLDSGTATYHLKALTNDEFDAWMTVIRKYVNHSNEKQFNDSEYHRASFYQQPGEMERLQSLYFKRQGLLERRQSLNKTSDQYNLDEDLGKIYGVFNNMDNEFNTIKENLDVLKNTIEGLILNNNNLNQPQPSPNNEGKSRKKFTLSLQRGITTPQSETIKPPSPVPMQMTLDQIYDKLSMNVTTLKKEKDQAFNLLRVEIEKWKLIDRAYRKLAAENVGLNESHVKNDSFDERLEHGPNDINYEISDNINGINKTRSMSMSTINTHSELFFDAEDIDLTEDLSATESDMDINNANISDEESDSSPAFIQPVSDGMYDKPTIVNDSSDSQPMIIQRRKVLPAPICGEDVSLLAILRKNVGKDLSTVSMPISLNEPINILQNMAEGLEYSELLDKAASLKNSMERLIYVAAFAVSGYASTYFRTGRKPFNPLHGETYECVRPDKGFRLISEKVSHHPPIMACHADSLNWSYWQDSKVKSKFWGKSMELIPIGTIHITIPKYNDHFTFSKPSTWVRNMISGTKYFEHAGVMRIENRSTGEACEITFNQSGMWSRVPNSDIVGILFSAKGEKSGRLVGKWNEIICHEKGPNQLEVIWKAHPPISDYEQYYGFTQFCIELNELTPDLDGHLPSTDTRFRPDQRLFENGEVEKAEAEKLRLEQKQREYRKLLEERGETWVPQWFKLEGEEWVYKGGYWEARENKNFKTKLQLW